MTGTEAALAARRYANAYKYIYGAKGEFCSSAHIEELIAQSPTYFSDAQKKTAAFPRKPEKGAIFIQKTLLEFPSWHSG